MMHSFENHRVVRHTGAEFPIFQAPIGVISRESLVSAVVAAGAVGLIETMFLDPAGMQEQFDFVRARTNRPIGLHFAIDWLIERPEQEKAMLK
ncbi:hypothetical protein GCM10011614_32260 [Novosphingobium colocasiae]|uniref:Nitronate monooxygenase n=1 Tax=Novosphingobium colocasiae TaxID=1256513 RepID=A0A918PMK7_9SPHN|nr:hypothetical protein GCM10011614_32260 [Novosphingobium colocasiae]